MTDLSTDPRVHVSLRDLMRMRHQVSGLSFRSLQPAKSLLAGRHASRIRGRGLHFEEIRTYQPGDDVRAIDWKVTARTRRPHTRVFNEERDRPTLLIVDQRMSMFFGTRRYMKSVTAAHVTAAAAWRALDQGDRVGAILFDDSSIEVIKPRRDSTSVARILQRVTSLNHQLAADNPASNPSMLSTVFQRAKRLAHHDFLVVIISDFIGLDDSGRRSLRSLARRNDFIGAVVHDPIASNLLDGTQMVVSDGELQLAIQPGKAARDIRAAASSRIADVLSLQRSLQASMLPISTAEEVLPQLHRLLGRT